jgi:hypothetical protein
MEDSTLHARLVTKSAMKGAGMSEERERIQKRDEGDVEGHMPRAIDEDAQPNPENDDPKARHEGAEDDEPEVEGHRILGK